MLDVTNKYGIHVLFSTKSDTTYDCDIRPDLHAFQLSITNVENHTNIEPNVPSIENRYKFYRELKNRGFKVGIRIHHIVPVSEGGSGKLDNLIMLCPNCHKKADYGVITRDELKKYQKLEYDTDNLNNRPEHMIAKLLGL